MLTRVLLLLVGVTLAQFALVWVLSHLRIPGVFGHPFRLNPDTCSGVFGHLERGGTPAFV